MRDKRRTREALGCCCATPALHPAIYWEELKLCKKAIGSLGVFDSTLTPKLKYRRAFSTIDQSYNWSIKSKTGSNGSSKVGSVHEALEVVPNEPILDCAELSEDFTINYDYSGKIVSTHYTESTTEGSDELQTHTEKTVRTKTISTENLGANTFKVTIDWVTVVKSSTKTRKKNGGGEDASNPDTNHTKTTKKSSNYIKSPSPDTPLAGGRTSKTRSGDVKDRHGLTETSYEVSDPITEQELRGAVAASSSSGEENWVSTGKGVSRITTHYSQGYYLSGRLPVISVVRSLSYRFYVNFSSDVGTYCAVKYKLKKTPKSGEAIYTDEHVHEFQKGDKTFVTIMAEDGAEIEVILISYKRYHSSNWVIF